MLTLSSGVVVNSPLKSGMANRIRPHRISPSKVTCKIKKGGMGWMSQSTNLTNLLV